MPSQGVENSLLQYGAVGLIALLAIFAVVYLARRDNEGRTQDRQRADRLEQALLDSNEKTRADSMSALASANQAVSDALARNKELEERIEELQQIARQKRRGGLPPDQ